jgi:hypothetical protein
MPVPVMPFPSCRELPTQLNLRGTRFHTLPHLTLSYEDPQEGGGACTSPLKHQNKKRQTGSRRKKTQQRPRCSRPAAAQDGPAAGATVHDVFGAAAAEGQEGQDAAAQEAQREGRQPRAEPRLLQHQQEPFQLQEPILINFCLFFARDISLLASATPTGIIFIFKNPIQ